MSKKRERHDLTVEELFALPEREFEEAIREALRDMIATGAVVDSGCSEDGKVRWTLAEELEGESPPEIKRN
jgi:hypothetical protein